MDCLYGAVCRRTFGKSVDAFTSSRPRPSGGLRWLPVEFIDRVEVVETRFHQPLTDPNLSLHRQRVWHRSSRPGVHHHFAQKEDRSAATGADRLERRSPLICCFLYGLLYWWHRTVAATR